MAVIEEKKMIAVWGANGFLGRHLVREFLKSGEAVKLFSRDFEGFPFPLPDGVQSYICDLNNPEDYLLAMKDCRVAVMLVTASLARSFSGSVEQEVEENLAPYKAFLECVQDTNIEHIVFAS